MYPGSLKKAEEPFLIDNGYDIPVSCHIYLYSIKRNMIYVLIPVLVLFMKDYYHFCLRTCVF